MPRKPSALHDFIGQPRVVNHLGELVGRSARSLVGPDIAPPRGALGAGEVSPRRGPRARVRRLGSLRVSF